MTDIETHVIGILVGICIVYIITVFLKKLIKEPRPSPVPNNYGMPSLSMSLITFIVFYICLASDDMWWAWLIGLIPILVIAYYKYYRKHHTILQLIVGGAIGIISALLLHTIVQS